MEERIVAIKCNIGRNGQQIQQGEQRRGQQRDWNCPGCGFLIFGRKDRCNKCNIGRNGKQIQGVRQQSTTTTDEICIICATNKINTLFIHDNDSHMVCCFDCAYYIYNSTHECPLCKKNIERLIKVFS